MDDGLPLDIQGMASGDPGAAGALELGKQTVRKELPKVASPQDYEIVPHGGAYLDPEGKQRFKPIRNKDDYLALEEGAEYADPSGAIRTKPKYEGIDFTPQTLYDIAHSDKGRKMALEKFYPGKVREDLSGGFYIEDEGGKFRKPGRGLSAVTGTIASEVIPTVLAGAGSLLGGAAGTAIEPGGGTVLGGAAGGYGGGYAGQRINDIFSQLAGVYDPEGGEANARMAGYAGAAGDVGGRAVAAAAPAFKEGARAVGRGASKTVSKFLGTDPEALETGLGIAEQGEVPGAGPFGLSKPGTAVSPSALFRSAPHVANVAETLQQKFDATDTYLANAERFMDKRAKDILASKDIGSIVEDSLVHPKAAVSTEQAGKLLQASHQAKVLQESFEADANLQAAITAKKAELAGPEKISWAAVQHNGKTYLGQTHTDAIEQIVKDTGKTFDQIADEFAAKQDGGRSSSGFYTSGNRYVTRSEAEELLRKQPTMQQTNVARMNAEGLHADRVKLGHGKSDQEFLLESMDPKTKPRIAPVNASMSAVAQTVQRESLLKTAEQAKAAADNLVQEGFRDIERQAADAVRVAQVGHNAGDLWRTVADSFVAMRRSLAQRAEQMYGDAHAASNGLVPPGAEGLAPRAQALLDQLPEGFAASHPNIVRRIAAMAGEIGENGEIVREPISAAWTQLHELRTMIRQDIKWNDLTSDVKNGALKHMQNGIDEVLHSVENQPALREASRLLKLADDFYHEHIGPFNNQQIKTLVKALNSGLQADPKALLKIAIQDGKTEVATTIKNTVGPQTWDAVRAADVQEMMAQSRQLDGSIDGLKFANMVEDRAQNGLLEVLHGDQGGARLRQQALYIKQLRGKLPIAPRPGDTANDIILRARSAAADAETKAASDPLKLLQNEMKKVESAVRKEMAANKKPDPLAFLSESTVGANKAVDKILSDPDLIVAASRAFSGGEKSPEFQLIRQIWTQRFLSETLEPGEKLAGTSEEIQKLMFPGITLDDMHMLAKEMKLLMGGKMLRGGGEDMGGSMMAQSAVENPWGRTGLGKVAGPLKIVPGMNALARATLTAYYNGVRGLLTSPSTLRWLRKGLTSRDPQAKEAARAELRAALQRGGAMGASAGEAVEQEPE